MIEGLARWIDRRVAGSGWAEKKLKKIFPESWAHLFGEIALYSFVVLVLTGTFLALFFDGSHTKTHYLGEYQPLNGVEVSSAYASTVKLSFDVPGGLLFRQMHHWAALIFTAAIVVHLCRVFFTGAFRRPREMNWMIGVTLLILAIIEGFAGYSLPDDLLSGTGLRIGYAIFESIPLIGTWLASFIFGGTFPGEHLLTRLYMLHIFLLPTLFFALIGLHLALVFRQTHTQFPGEGRREDNVVGLPLWPTYTALSFAMFFIVSGVIAGLGGLFQINPVWFYGPYDPYVVSIGSQPDWYMGWLEGSLRLMPPWEFRGLGYMIPNPFLPAVLLPALTFLGLYAYPFIERRLTKDTAEHHLLDRPRDRPVRSAFGAAMLTFYGVLTIAGSSDLLAYELRVPVSGLVVFLRGATIIAPVLVYFLTYNWCRGLAVAKERPPGMEWYEEEPREEEPEAETATAEHEPATASESAS
ncbi:MAG: cytochrome bc complex cytochrome b subunit [Nitriliruptorales bacterium]